MANTVKHKRSNIAGTAPTAAQVDIGELAINFVDKKIYTQEPGGTIIQLASVILTEGTLAQRAALTNVRDGDIFYVTGDPTVTENDRTYTYSTTSAQWIEITAGRYSTVKLDAFTGDGIQSAFTLSDSPVSDAHVFAYINGVMQQDTSYNVTGNTITFTAPVPNGASIEVRSFTALSITDAVPLSGGTMTGNLGVNGTTTLNNLTVTGATNFPGTDTYVYFNDAGTLGQDSGITYNKTTDTLAVTETVEAKHFNNVSDNRLKDNVQQLQNAVDVLSKLNPVSFNWKNDGAKSFGFIAQEVENVLPSIVHEGKDGIKTVTYIEIIAWLVAAVKDLNERVSK